MHPSFEKLQVPTKILMAYIYIYTYRRVYVRSCLEICIITARENKRNLLILFFCFLFFIKNAILTPVLLFINFTRFKSPKAPRQTIITIIMIIMYPISRNAEISLRNFELSFKSSVIFFLKAD